MNKQRHGCVTAWLILMIIANSFIAITYLFLGESISKNMPNPMTQQTLQILALIGIANLIFSIMLFQWKKWAFWAFAGTSIVTLMINLSNEMGISTSLLGLSGIIILYGILQIKKDGVTAWENLS